MTERGITAKMRNGGTDMYECFHCLSRSVIWDSDFTFEDYGLEGEGLVHHCHCTNCGAEIEYYVPITDEDVEELKERFGDDEQQAKG